MQSYLLKSSNIDEIGYDLNTLTLQVRFKNSSIYEYSNVPHDVVMEVLFGESVGREFNRLIKKGGFLCEEVFEDDDDEV